MTPTSDRRIERITTADGASIACKHRPGSGPPVIIVHGLGVNADIWDAPDHASGNGIIRSLATLLHEADYDVWLMNLRGYGRPHMHSRPPPGQSDWCVDHFILYDLPAVIESVQQRSGRRPFLIGNSMGAMSLAAYWQGARLDGTGPAARIRADEDAARRRQAAAAGSIMIEFPAALRWPVSLYDESGRLRWRELLEELSQPRTDSNHAFEWLAQLAWLEAILSAVGVLRFDWVRPRETPEQPGSARQAGGAVARYTPAAFARLRESVLRLYSEKFKGASSFDPDSFVCGILPAADHVKAGVLSQLARSVRARAFVSALGAVEHVYSDHYHLIALPTLVLAGGRDRIANAEVTRAVFWERLAATDKSFLLFDELAHGEFCYTPHACTEVYPRILEWLRERRALS